MGRTDFDYAAIKILQPNIKYHYCPENLRKEFINSRERWKVNVCEQFSVFMSQATYPIKGLHFALMAIGEVKKFYPHVKLYVAGANYYQRYRFRDRIKQGSYAKYINTLIDKYDLEENVIFVGEINASLMKEHYLRTNVFILPSVMENSPNSLMEAMALGVPAIAADVGGVSSIVTHKYNGYLYPVDEYYLLAYYILNIFSNDKVAVSVSENAYYSVKKRIDLKKNINTLANIYTDIIREN